MQRIKAFFRSVDWKAFGKRILSALRGFLSRNIATKLLSILLALILWNYVITTNPNITRDKTITDLTVSVTGQSVLTSRNLALLSDIGSMVSNARARVTVPQSSFGLVSDSNVRIEADLTSIRTTGKQRVLLKGSSVYGEVVQIWPEYIDLTVEELDQRNIPVNINLSGGDGQSYWYSAVANPSQVSVSGPASIVQTIASADIAIDVTGITSPLARALRFQFMDENGAPVERSLTRSTSSVMVHLDPYPMKTVSIVSSPADIFNGSLPAGYELTSVSITPETVTIAAEQNLLDSISSLSFNKIDLTNRTSSFTRTLNLSSLNGLKYISTTQVTVNVVISEIAETRTVEGIVPVYTRVPEGYLIESSAVSVPVTITGPHSQIETVTPEDITVTIVIGALEAGQYTLPAVVTVTAPSVTGTTEPVTITVLPDE